MLNKGTEPHVTPVKTFKRYEYLDSLRGLAILCILAAHTNIYGSNSLPSWFYNFTSIGTGPRGVQLFYLVSAFTLCLSFSKRKDKEKHVLKNFYLRRFFRIAPLFYIAILYYLWQAHYVNTLIHYSFANILTTFTFMNGLSPYWINNIVFGGWSITIEAAFYLIFPFLFYKFNTIRSAIIITFCTMIMMQFFRLFLLSLPFIQHAPDIQTYTFQFFPSQLPVFLIGMTVFMLKTSPCIDKDKKVMKFFILLFFGILLIQIIFGLKIIAGHYIYSLFFAALLYTLSKYPFKILVNPFTRYLGKVSFSLYLCHLAILYWLNHFRLIDLLPSFPLVNYFIRFLLLLLFSTAAASILYYIIERRGQIIGKKIIDHYEKKSTVPSTTTT